jgi:hypothetical protein
MREALRGYKIRFVTDDSREMSAGGLRDLRRSVNAGLNVPSVDPDDQLESVGATPLAPTKLSNRAAEFEHGR